MPLFIQVPDCVAQPARRNKTRGIDFLYVMDGVCTAIDIDSFQLWTKKPPEGGFLLLLGGRGGIRTRGRLLTYARFPGVWLKPLIHPSGTVDYTIAAKVAPQIPPNAT